MIIDNTPHVRNPLTIIAMFSAIAEVSGTVVISFLAPAQQQIFVWFLVFFPILIVIAFFLTLNLNPKALYAPSDFTDENNFLKVHRYNLSSQTSISEQILVESRTSDTKKLDLVEQYLESNFSEFSVSVSNFSDALDLVSSLNEKGYAADLYETESEIASLEEHESIWVGKSIDTDFAVKVIKDAVNFYPHLKYLHLSGDNGSDPPEYVHSNIYIGGSSSTANRYGLRPVPREVFQSLSQDMTVQEFHRLIRNYYD